MKIFINIKLIYRILSSAKFQFLKPKRVDILLYDQGAMFNKIVYGYFKKYKKSILYARFEQLNVYVLLTVLVKLKFLNGLSLFQNYVIEYCKISKPKIIISSTLWDERILLLKKYIDYKFKIVLVQLFPLKKEYFKRLNKKKYKIDHFFYFDKKSLKIIKENFLANFLNIGSFKNNNEDILRNEKINKDVLLISFFKKKNYNEGPASVNIQHKLNILYEKRMLEILSQKLIKNSKFKVILKPNVLKKDYLEFMNCDKNIAISNNGNAAYKAIDMSDVVITLIESAMSDEALSRGVKHVLISQEEKNYTNNFYEFKQKVNYNNIKKFINYYSKISKKSFFNICKKNKLEIMPYDNDNLIFKKTLTNELLNLNKNI